MFQLEIVPQWNEEGFNIPIEVKVGSLDSQSRLENPPEEEEEEEGGAVANVTAAMPSERSLPTNSPHDGKPGACFTEGTSEIAGYFALETTVTSVIK